MGRSVHRLAVLPGATLGGVHRIAGWWDAIELWVAGLPFIPQFALVLVVMIPVSFGIARTLDGVLITVLRWSGRGTDDTPSERRD